MHFQNAKIFNLFAERIPSAILNTACANIDFASSTECLIEQTCRIKSKDKLMNDNDHLGLKFTVNLN